jgi:hypothetical protein
MKMALRILMMVLAIGLLGLAGCSDGVSPGMEPGDDAGMGDADAGQDTEWICDPDNEDDCWPADGGKPDANDNDGGPNDNDGGPNDNDGGPNDNDGGPNDNDGGPNDNDGGPDDNDGGPDNNDGGDDGSDPDWDDTDPDPEICDIVEMSASGVPPNVMLVVDRSGSMADPISEQADRAKIEDTKEALHGLLDMGEEFGIRFGWAQFPLLGDCVPGVVTVGCDEDTAGSIRVLVLMLTPNGGTPTGETLQNVAEHESLHDPSRANFAILLTDGMPTCPTGEGMDETQEDGQLALTAVETLRTEGIETFVIGLGEEFGYHNPDLLNLMAEAGGRARAGAVKYYPAGSLDELQAVLDTIGQQVMECGIQLDRAPDDPEWVWVYLDGVEAVRDPVNGWTYDPALNQVNFHGAMCDQLRSGQVSHVQVEVGCLIPR